MCSAARRKTRSKCRNAKQIKFRASQKQRSEFLAVPFHMAPPGRQKSERDFCLFCAVCAHLSLIFRLFLPDFCLSKVFSLVAHAATGTPFSFRKENGGKEPRGERRAAPLRTPFQRPAANLPFSLAAGRLTRPSAANRRLTGKRLKSQGAKLSFSSVSVRRRTPAPFRLSPPFSRCWPA